MLVDGLIGGVGGVIIFLPQIMVLFFFIALLEDCGYMARAAYLMDKLMVRVGLSGKSFIPLLSSFACAIPGVMATRVIENRRDRLTTILVAPLMSCTARLPVYTLLIAAFIPNRLYLAGIVSLQALVMTAMYLLGIATAVCVAFVLKRHAAARADAAVRARVAQLQMALSPDCGLPRVRARLGLCLSGRHADRGRVDRGLGRAVLSSRSADRRRAFRQPASRACREPRSTACRFAPARGGGSSAGRRRPSDCRRLSPPKLVGTNGSLDRAGRAAAGLGLADRLRGDRFVSAREVVVATLGIIYNLGEDLDLENQADASRLESTLAAARWEGTDRLVFNVPVALSIMVFFALCAQCASTLVIIKPRNQQLALAAVYVRLHDRVGLRGGLDHLPGGHAAGVN